eukprot:scaffold237481_cov63-Attheya_sp.AAC.3
MYKVVYTKLGMIQDILHIKLPPMKQMRGQSDPKKGSYAWKRVYLLMPKHVTKSIHQADIGHHMHMAST